MLLSTLVAAILPLISVQAESMIRGWAIERQLIDRHYQCASVAASGEDEWAFQLSFRKWHRRRAPDLFMTRFSGDFTGADGKPVTVQDEEQSQVDVIDPVQKRFEIAVRDLSFSFFHAGRPRHFQGRLHLTSELDRIEGEVAYRVGRRSEKRRVSRKIQCSLLPEN